MFSKFFAQDNATAKLASTLILIASILQVLVSSIPSPDAVKYLLVVISVLGIAAQFFKSNKVITRSGWLLLCYSVASYLSTAEGLKGSLVIVSIAGIFKVLADYSITSTTPQSPDAPAQPKTED